MHITISRKARISGWIVLIFITLYTIAGFFILPPYLKKVACEQLSEQLGRRVIIETVSLNPYTLSATVKGFEIKEQDGSAPFVSFGSLFVELKMASVLKGIPVIREIRLEKPRVNLVRTKANRYNFSDITDRMKARPVVAPKKPEKPFSYSVSNIRIIDGDIEFDDRPASTKHAITVINIGIPFISNLPIYVESFVQPSFSATINGSPVSAKGTTRVFSDSHETSFDLAFRDIDIPYYLRYAPAELNIRVPSGKLDVLMTASYRQYKDRAPLLALSGETRLKDLVLAIKKPQDDFLKIPLLTIRDIAIDLAAQKIEVNSITAGNGTVVISRSVGGQLNAASVMTSPSTTGKTPAKTASPSPSKQNTPWTLALKSLVIDGYTVKIIDRSLAEPFGITLDEINIKAGNISTAKNTAGTVSLSMRVDRKGLTSIDGSMTLDPPAVDVAIGLKGIPLKPTQPFLSAQTRILLASGALGLDGRLNARQDETRGPTAAFRGILRINNLSLLDRTNAEELLSWDTLSLGTMDVRYSPLYVHVPEIVLSRFSSRIIVNADRVINLQQVFRVPGDDAAVPSGPATQPTGTAADTPQKPAEQRTIRIDRITLQNGAINFTDDSIKPRFSSNMIDINGRATGLSSDENTTGDVELRGNYDNSAPLEITGRINPLRNDLFVDLKATFKDMDLTTVSPYAGRYAGYAVQKGKLSFQLDYQIVKNKLDAKNNVFLNQFTFGDAVQSEEATKLPVRLAVSLLKDRKGDIALDIPVTGELTDPKFSVGGIILKVIVNLLVKAATSPFALLGAVFGGGEQLSYAEFENGTAALSDATMKKLDILGKALYERPALTLDIVGHADPEQDREGLKQNMMLRKIKAGKLKTMLKNSNETPSLDSITVTPQEYPDYLKKAYREEKFKKPRNALGMQKDIPVPEMEKLMLANMKVSDEDLKALAAERARVVRDYLLQPKQIEPERIFIVEAKTLVAEKKEGAKITRVDFTLK